MMGYNIPCKRLLFRGASFSSVALCKESLDQACFRSALCLEHHISIYSALRNDSCIPRHSLKDSRNGRIVPPFNFELSVVQAMAEPQNHGEPQFAMEATTTVVPKNKRRQPPNHN